MRTIHPLFMIDDPPVPENGTDYLDLRKRIDKIGKLQIKTQAMLESSLRGEDRGEGGEMAEAIFAMIDSLEAAIEGLHAETDPGSRKTVDGLAMTVRKALDELERLGIHAIKTVGEPFDPKKHLAVSRAERESVADRIIVGEDRKGYTKDGHVLRLAEVVVNRVESSN